METKNEKTVYEVNSETVFAAETCHLREAEVLMASLEECIHRRFNPRPLAYMSKGELTVVILKTCYHLTRQWIFCLLCKFFILFIRIVGAITPTGYTVFRCLPA